MVRYAYDPNSIPPSIENSTVTGTSSSGASFNGTLTSTGTSACAVGVYWGTDTNAWGNTNWFNDGAVNSAWTNNTPFSTNVTLDPDSTYYYTYVASNASGVAIASPAMALITADVTLQATDANASWVPGDTGAFNVARGAGLTNAALLVNFAIGGTGANGSDYSSIASNVTISAGQTNALITISPNVNPPGGGTRTVILTLTSGGYVIGTPSNGTVTIERKVGNISSAGNGNWHDSATWSPAVVPGADDNVTQSPETAIEIHSQARRRSGKRYSEQALPSQPAEI